MKFKLIKIDKTDDAVSETCEDTSLQAQDIPDDESP